MKSVLIGLIRFYRRYLSIYKLPTCKYYPTCSQYAEESLQKYGVVNGLLRSAWRLLRCNPFSKGGYDPPVKPKGKPV